MKIRVIAFGKPALSYCRDGISDYEKRLKRYGGIQLNYLKAGKDTTKQLADASKGCLRIVLDERGADWTTKKLTSFIDAQELSGGGRDLAFLIGPFDGHSAETRSSADHVLRLSALTLQHEHALLVLLEQIYRVRTIQAGTPYHK